ncbi:MAG: hypothetical protein J6U58_00945 [Bacteroidaceae bacterium]|nr:hypothetical protein [Bacteroidaceae bacterium]
MKKLLIIFFLSFVALSGYARGKSDKDSLVYIFGASLSFSDSVVYFTEIQQIDDVISEKGFLQNRQLYSYELKDYMSSNEGMPGRISVIYFADKLKDLEKKEKNVKKHLETKENMIVRYLGSKFKFTKQ